jgi:hypothetical protein
LPTCAPQRSGVRFGRCAGWAGRAGGRDMREPSATAGGAHLRGVAAGAAGAGAAAVGAPHDPAVAVGEDDHVAAGPQRDGVRRAVGAEGARAPLGGARLADRCLAIVGD